MPTNTALNSQAREVIDTSPWFAIATAVPDGPHQAACWTRNIQALNYADTRARTPLVSPLLMSNLPCVVYGLV